MSENICKYQTEQVNTKFLEAASEALVAHCKNKRHFSLTPFKTEIRGVDSSDYTNRGMKRAKFEYKIFQNTKFINSAAAGSVFTNCKFQECFIQNANFQECTFLHNHIQNHLKEKQVIHSNFNSSLFADDFEIKNTYFAHCVFQKTAFIKGTIKSTTFYSSTLEDSVFSDVSLEKVTFSDLNIDYSVFERVKMKHVILPFSQVCYAFGLLPYLLHTDDEIYITSVTNSDGYISREAFLKLLPQFETYYTGVRELFPLANMKLALGQKEEVYDIVSEGILRAISICDFRQIKYFCKLIYTYSIFSFHERKQIYDYMNAHISFSDMNPSLAYHFQTYKNEIESLLLSNNRAGIITSEIDIITNIYPHESLQLGKLLSILEEIIEEGKSEYGEHSIICRHNSAEEVVVVIQEIYQSLQIIIPSIYSILLGVMVLEEKIVSHKKLQAEKGHIKHLKEIEIEKAAISLEREKLALKKEREEYAEYQAKKAEETNRVKNQILRRNILDNHISIAEIHHMTYGNIPPEAIPDILEFSCKKDSSES